MEIIDNPYRALLVECGECELDYILFKVNLEEYKWMEHLEITVEVSF